MKKDLTHIQLEYHQPPLSKDQLKADPREQLINWFHLVEEKEISYPNAVFLATVDEQGKPHQRTVLIKDIAPDGITIFTDYNSSKGRHIAHNPNVSLLFFWKELDRQVRINGKAEKLDRSASETYFASRKRASQLSALASAQSQPVSYEQLQAQRDRLDKQYPKTVPCPEDWGGYLIKYSEFEFWQGRPNRLHDRFHYSQFEGEWKISRLAP